MDVFEKGKLCVRVCAYACARVCACACACACACVFCMYVSLPGMDCGGLSEYGTCF